MRATWLVALAVVAGCTDDRVRLPITSLPLPPSGPSTARQMFDATVAPLVAAKCASCHVGAETTPVDMFLGPSQTNDSFYDAITNDRAIHGLFSPAAAQLLTWGAHEGPAWTAIEATAIAAWLDAEFEERGITGCGGPEGAMVAEARWASCLESRGSELAASGADRLGAMTTTSGATCTSCHAHGAGGVWLAGARATLAAWQSIVFELGVTEAEVQDDGSYVVRAPVQALCNAGTELQDDAGVHPSFDCNQQVDGVQPVLALQRFVADVEAHAEAGACGGPGNL